MYRLSRLRQERLLLFIVAPLFFVLTIIAYLPGLHGGFLFDDYINLPAIGAQGPIDNWPAFWRYITSGTADPTGRPLTLLTFLLDARDWPASPYAFKRTALTLHLVNGLLLYLLLVRVDTLLRDTTLATHRLTAACGAGIWLLHPLLVSTTLYIIQREAMLPATCVLLGLLAWLHGRSKFSHGEVIGGIAWSAGGLAGFTVLGTLAKANGALLPAFVLLFEGLIKYRQPIIQMKAQRWHHGINLVLAKIPTIAICAYLGWIGIRGAGHGHLARSWTYGERLLTEPRVVVDYLRLLWMPRAVSSGLFNDNYQTSTSLLQPVTTGLAIALLCAMGGVAWKVRRRYPALTLALGFFFVGHLIESTTLPLELYFEHRNYLPALLMFYPLAWWIGNRDKHPTVKTVLILILPMSLAALTYSRASVWGNDLQQALIWAQVNPDSPRAQANAAQAEMQAGRPDLAVERLQKALRNRPTELQLTFNLVGARCMTGYIPASDLEAARLSMANSGNTGALFSSWLDRMLPMVKSNACTNLTIDSLIRIIDAGFDNSRLSNPASRQDLLFLKAKVLMAGQRANDAYVVFTQALEMQPTPGIALEAAAALGAAGQPEKGLQILAHYQLIKAKAPRPGFGMPQIHQWVLDKQNYWSNEIARLKQTLQADASTDRTRRSHQPAELQDP
jgi:tetratricopeptide (TPR) repeat protein